METIVIYTDGSGTVKQSVGGWAFVVCAPYHHEEAGAEAYTSNNRMELTAVIRALESVGTNRTVELCSDSEYVVRGVNEWLRRWKNRNWLSSSGKPVKNQDLWERLDALIEANQVTMKWVRGHVGNPFNERADLIAGAARDAFKAVVEELASDRPENHLLETQI